VVVLSRALALASVVFAVFVASSLLPSVQIDREARTLAYLHHDPILVTNNSFGLFPGAGSASDPYVIEDMEIDGDGLWMSPTVPCIEIRDSDAHFVIRNNHLRWNGVSGLGVELERCSNGTIENNTVDHIYLGMWILDSNNCSVRGNSISTSGGQEEMGLFLLNSRQCSVWGNTFHSNGVIVCGDLLVNVITNDIESNNTVNGLPIVFVKNQENFLLDNIVAGQVLVANCENFTISNLSISDVDSGVALYFVSNVTVENLQITRTNWDAMAIYNSTELVIRFNHLYSNGYNGMTFYNVKGAEVSCNLMEENWPSGIASMFNSSGLIAFHNNLINNSEQIWGGMTLDAGYPTGGNYYSDYSGQDMMSGPDQDITGPDGIGDVPYMNASYEYPSQRDRYPLMERFDSWPRAVFNVSESSSIVDNTLIFNASSCWDLGEQSSALSVRWDFNDDGVWEIDWRTEKTAQWQYSEQGSYTVRLEVRDSHGLTNNTTMRIEIIDPSIPEFTSPLVPIVSVMFLVAVVVRRRLRRR